MKLLPFETEYFYVFVTYGWLLHPRAFKFPSRPTMHTAQCTLYTYARINLWKSFFKVYQTGRKLDSFCILQSDPSRKKGQFSGENNFYICRFCSQLSCKSCAKIIKQIKRSLEYGWMRNMLDYGAWWPFEVGWLILFDWLIWLMEWLMDGLIYWLDDWLIEWLTNWLIGLLMDLFVQGYDWFNANYGDTVKAAIGKTKELMKIVWWKTLFYLNSILKFFYLVLCKISPRRRKKC